MIHGIYLRNKPKASWRLVSTAASAEAANYDLKTFLEQAQKEGNELAEVAVQIYDTDFYIPEILREIKEQKILYN